MSSGFASFTALGTFSFASFTTLGTFGPSSFGWFRLVVLGVKEEIRLQAVTKLIHESLNSSPALVCLLSAQNWDIDWWERRGIRQ